MIKEKKKSIMKKEEELMDLIEIWNSYDELPEIVIEFHIDKVLREIERFYR